MIHLTKLTYVLLFMIAAQVQAQSIASTCTFGREKNAPVLTWIKNGQAVASYYSGQPNVEAFEQYFQSGSCVSPGPQDCEILPMGYPENWSGVYRFAIFIGKQQTFAYESFDEAARDLPKLKQFGLCTSHPQVWPKARLENLLRDTNLLGIKLSADGVRNIPKPQACRVSQLTTSPTVNFIQGSKVIALLEPEISDKLLAVLSNPDLCLPAHSTCEVAAYTYPPNWSGIWRVTIKMDGHDSLLFEKSSQAEQAILQLRSVGTCR